MENAMEQIKELNRQLRISRFNPRRKEVDKLRRENLQLSLHNERLLIENNLLKKAYDSLLIKTK